MTIEIEKIVWLKLSEREARNLLDALNDASVIDQTVAKISDKLKILLDEANARPQVMSYEQIKEATRDLAAKGLIVDSGRQRPGRNGEMEPVWVATPAGMATAEAEITSELADKIIETVYEDGCIDNVEMLLDQYVEQGASRTDTIAALELAQKKLRADALVDQVAYANALQWQVLVQHLFDDNSNWLNTWLNTLAQSRPDAAMALAEALSEHDRNRRKLG